MTPILLLRGAPGVGKSSVAAVLRDLHGMSIVEVDDLRGELWHVPELAPLSDWARHSVAIAQAAAVALSLDRGRPVAVVDTFNRHALATFLHALRGRAEAVPVSLVASRGALEHRLRTRPGAPGVFRDLAVAAALNEELHTEPQGCWVDTTEQGPKVIARRVLDRVYGDNVGCSVSRPAPFRATLPQ